MGKIRIGKVRLTGYGKFNIDTKYPMSAVVYDERLRVCISKVEDNIGNPLDDSSKWGVMFQLSEFIEEVRDLVKDSTKRVIMKMSSSDNAVTLLPWKMYEFPEMAQLRVTLSEPKVGELNEWQFSFNSAASATVLSLPENITWAAAYSILPNMHYEINVQYNESEQKYYGVMVSWAC